jgi:hypothetical protein
MYAYRPKFQKKKEKLISGFLTALGIVLYFTAHIPGAPYPAFIQLAAFVCLAGMILLVSMCIMRSYEYAIEETKDGKIDFVITEHYGRRTTVVCRVSLSDVQSVLPLTSETKEQYKALKKQGSHYSYTGVLFDEKCYLVEMHAHGEHVFVRVCADETLLNLLAHH